MWRRKAKRPKKPRWYCEPTGHRVVTEDLVLRPLYENEVNAFLELIDDEIIERNGWRDDWRSDWADAEARLAPAPPGPPRPIHLDPRITDFVIEADGAIAGSISLTSVDDLPGHAVETGFWLGPRHRGRGLAPKAIDAVSRLAFAHFGLTHVVAATSPDNDAAQRALLRAGFEPYGSAPRELPDGTLVQAIYFVRQCDIAVPSSCRR